MADSDLMKVAEQNGQILSQAANQANQITSDNTGKGIKEFKQQQELARKDLSEYFNRAKAMNTPMSIAGYNALDMFQDTLGVARPEMGSAKLAMSLDRKAQVDRAFGDLRGNYEKLRSAYEGHPMPGGISYMTPAERYMQFMAYQQGAMAAPGGEQQGGGGSNIGAMIGMSPVASILGLGDKLNGSQGSSGGQGGGSSGEGTLGFNLTPPTEWQDPSDPSQYYYRPTGRTVQDIPLSGMWLDKYNNRNNTPDPGDLSAWMWANDPSEQNIANQAKGWAYDIIPYEMASGQDYYGGGGYQPARTEIYNKYYPDLLKSVQAYDDVARYYTPEQRSIADAFNYGMIDNVGKREVY